jgi:hypothetical protein
MSRKPNENSDNDSEEYSDYTDSDDVYDQLLDKIIKKYDKSFHEFRSITMNLNDKKQFIDDPCRIVKCSQYYQSLLLKYLSPYASYDCFLEYSRPERWHDRISRIHIHGIIRFNNAKSMMAFYVESVHKLMKECEGEIDRVRDVDIWLEYITEDNRLVRDYCESYKCNWYFSNHDKRPQLYNTWFPSLEKIERDNNILDKLKSK